MTKLSALFKISRNKQSLVLMYHKIANTTSDVWDISVTPENFEQHLKVLKKKGNVVPVEMLINSLYSGNPVKNKVALTFDDGYADNFHMAAPLLQKYNLPATFFITGSGDELMSEYWWDCLERIILFAEVLPLQFSMRLTNERIQYDIADESVLTLEIRQLHNKWRACVQEPPTKRARLYYHLWSAMKSLSYEDQCIALDKVKKWADAKDAEAEKERILTVTELQIFSKNTLFSFGGHTVTHPALGLYELPSQKKEIKDNIEYLQKFYIKR